MYFLHLRVALTALAMQYPQHYIRDTATKIKGQKMYEYQKDPLYQSLVLSIEEIEAAHRRAKKLQSTAFVSTIQNLFESRNKPSVRATRNIQMPLSSSKGFA